MSKQALVAPLDWGLGHTARCIPIIEDLLKQQYQVIFAGTKNQQSFIQQHNLNLKFVDLFGYNVKYSSLFPQWIIIAAQFNRLKKLVAKENQWLNEFIKKEKIDLIISDNRYGMYTKNCTSVFVGHQLYIQSSFLQKKINTLHAKYINHFSECWIPDDDKINLSGLLSFNPYITIPTKKIGILSRLKKEDTKSKQNFDLLLLLSGNEPQRSLLEKKLLNQLKNTNYKIALVRGTSTPHQLNKNNLSVYNLINANTLQALISQSSTIICRSGYSSIMDLINFDKKIIFIPTPGQTEQEYLAKHLKKTRGVSFLKQNKLRNLIQLINRCKQTTRRLTTNNHFICT